MEFKNCFSLIFRKNRSALHFKKVTFLIILASCLFFPLNSPDSFAQDTSKTFVILYSNNINGEIDPCPV